jgi:hypothetical protein
MAALLAWHRLWPDQATACALERVLAGGRACRLCLGPPHPVQAKTFHCSGGDVQCLIVAINEANANGQKNTIRLSAGTYTLTAVDNTTEGSPSERNGMPSITGTLTLRGTGPDTTIIERAASAPPFRLLHCTSRPVAP